MLGGEGWDGGIGLRLAFWRFYFALNLNMFHRVGHMHNRGWDSLEPRPKAHPRCPAPLDSGFRRNDGGYAQHPPSGYRHSRFQRPSFPRTRESRERQSPPLVPRARRHVGWSGATVFFILDSRVRGNDEGPVLIRGWDLDAAEG